ncbi:MAG: 30S ribosome-binding factor RbfA [Limisphaerales bacterium]|jgi:ribosome-binding factor A|nr:30S ribosome-binding factor RbfA [Verrucomicrobiota bacterium]
MQSLRHQRVRELIKREAGDLLREHLSLETYGMVSVHEVFVSGDLKHAKVLMGHIGKTEQQIAAEQYLVSHRGMIQLEMSHRVQLKYSPQVKFSFDDSIAQGNSVLDILEDMEQSGELEP